MEEYPTIRNYTRNLLVNRLNVNISSAIDDLPVKQFDLNDPYVTIFEDHVYQKSKNLKQYFTHIFDFITLFSGSFFREIASAYHVRIRRRYFKPESLHTLKLSEKVPEIFNFKVPKKIQDNFKKFYVEDVKKTVGVEIAYFKRSLDPTARLDIPIRLMDIYPDIQTENICSQLDEKIWDVVFDGQNCYFLLDLLSEEDLSDFSRNFVLFLDKFDDVAIDRANQIELFGEEGVEEYLKTKPKRIIDLMDHIWKDIEKMEEKLVDKNRLKCNHCRKYLSNQGITSIKSGKIVRFCSDECVSSYKF